MLIDLSRVRVSGQLSAFATGFADHMTRQGYSPHQTRLQLLLLNHLSNWLASEGLVVGELRAKEVEQFQLSRHEAGYSFLRSIRAMQPILGYLRGLGIVPAALSPPVSGVLEAALARYRGYLILERGIRNASASRYIELMRPFLQTKVLPDGLALDLRSLTAADVISFVVTNCSRLSPGTAGLTVTALRSLLGFLYVDGAIDRSLVSAVPTVPGRRLTGLPKGLASDQVQRLLASCNTSTRSGCRDFAVLTMLVRLGLRAGEVAKLQLEHIDWRAGEIVIAHSKGNRTERLPLPADVGEAIAAYLRRGRPASTPQGRTVFVRITAPHHALTTGAVTQIVRHAGERCGFEPIHAHRLRHTAATLMLRGGASLPEIGQLLRHRNAITTSIYAKVDRDALRSIARPWPGDVA
jgi:integrase/recombinase XerD